MMKNPGDLTPADLLLEALARAIDKTLNGDAKPQKYGFMLFVFPFDRQIASYASNCHRDDVLSMLKEFIARSEGKSLHPAPEGLQ